MELTLNPSIQYLPFSSDVCLTSMLGLRQLEFSNLAELVPGYHLHGDKYQMGSGKNYFLCITSIHMKRGCRQ